MLKEHMSEPYRLVCITDHPEGITECETYPLWDFPRVTQGTIRRSWDAYRRLRLFDPEVGRLFGERIVSTDLDVLFTADPSPLFTDDFKGVAGDVSHINASLYTLKVGTNRHVWDTFDPETAAILIQGAKHNGRHLIGSDQAWMSIQMPDAPLWDGRDGVWTSHRLLQMGKLPFFIRFVAFPGNLKPWDEAMKRKFPALRDEYMRHYG